MYIGIALILGQISADVAIFFSTSTDPIFSKVISPNAQKKSASGEMG